MANITEILSYTRIGLLLVLLASLTGACSNIRDYERQCQECVNQLVQSWRAHPNANCSEQYNTYKNCLSKITNRCLSIPTPDKRTTRIIKHLFKVYAADQTFFCKYGMFSRLPNNKPSTFSMCSSKLLIKAEKCSKKYTARFSRDRGSPKMCRWFYRVRQCMLKAVKRNCKASRVTSLLLSKYAKPYNPYCKGNKDNKRQGDKGFGRCTRKSYVIKSRHCITQFVHRLQKNNGQQCRAIVSNVLIPCVKSCMRRCLQGTRDDKALDDDLTTSLTRKQSNIQNKYCEGGHLETLALSRQQCSQEYFETFQGRCNAKFLTLFRQNRSSQKLCQAYSDVKECARNMTLSMCQLDRNMKDTVYFVYGDFNPFCSDAKDPHIRTSRQATSEERTLTRNNTAIAHAWSTEHMLVTIATALLLFK